MFLTDERQRRDPRPTRLVGNRQPLTRAQPARLRKPVVPLLLLIGVIDFRLRIGVRQHAFQAQHAGRLIAAHTYAATDLPLGEGRAQRVQQRHPLTRFERDVVQACVHLANQRIGVRLVLHTTCECAQQTVEHVQTLRPGLAVLAMAQVGVHHEVAPRRVQHVDQHLRHVAIGELVLHRPHHRPTRSAQLLLALTGAHRAFEVATVGTRLAIHERTQLRCHPVEHGGVGVEPLHRALHQFLDLLADVTVDAVDLIGRGTQLGQLVQHGDGSVRMLGGRIQKLGIAQCQFLQRDLELADPVLDAVGEQLVLTDRAHQVLDHIHRVTGRSRQRAGGTAIALAQHVQHAVLDAARQTTGIGHARLQFGQCAAYLVGLEYLMRRRTGGGHPRLRHLSAGRSRPPGHIEQATCGVIDAGGGAGKGRAAGVRLLAEGIHAGSRTDGRHTRSASRWRHRAERIPAGRGAGLGGRGVHVAQHRRSRRLQCAVDLALDLARQLTKLGGRVQRTGDDSRPEGHHILVAPRLVQQTKALPQLGQWLRELAFRLGHDLGHRQPVLELVGVDQRQGLWILSNRLTLATPLECGFQVDHLVDLIHHLGHQHRIHLPAALVQQVHGVEDECLQLIAAGITRLDQQVLIGLVEKRLGQLWQRVLDDFAQLRRDPVGVGRRDARITQ